MATSPGRFYTRDHTCRGSASPGGELLPMLGSQLSAGLWSGVTGITQDGCCHPQHKGPAGASSVETMKISGPLGVKNESTAAKHRFPLGMFATACQPGPFGI